MIAYLIHVRNSRTNQFMHTVELVFDSKSAAELWIARQDKADWFRYELLQVIRVDKDSVDKFFPAN